MKPLQRLLVSICLLVCFDVHGQIITTVAGNGTSGYNGDSIQATAAKIGYSASICSDSAGNIFLGDVNNARIRKIDISSGIIITIAGTGSFGFSGDDGVATNAQIHPFICELVTDDTGNLYFSDTYNSRVRKISKNGIIRTVAGNGLQYKFGDGGVAISASFGSVNSIAIDSQNNLFVCDSGVWIRKISTTGIITTIAGNGIQGNTGDSGPATAAQIICLGMTCDRHGNLFFAQPPYIRKVNLISGIISTIAGDGSYIYNNGVPATSTGVGAEFLVFDKHERLFFSEKSSSYNRVRFIDTNGMIQVCAGDGTNGYGGDNGPPYLAKLSYPRGLTIDHNGSLYVADQNNLRIRKVTKPFVLALENAQQNKPLTIYPTPTTGTLHIDNLKAPATYTLYDITGRVVATSQLTIGPNELNTTHLSPGIYLLHLQHKDGTREVHKIVKE